jgi:hypothetical protein
MRRVIAEQIEALAELNSIVQAQPASHDLSGRREPSQPPATRRDEPEPRHAPLGETTIASRNLAPAPAQAVEMPSDHQHEWLRDTLATKQAREIEPSRTITLSNLTKEIARSIDSGALADAWARYQTGDGNVFSRRIYTLTGQGTYDEVRRKIQRDPEFARTASAYVEEFEQLLRKAASGPNAAQETRNHLLSDRGKVYTMLAHASGRLN